VDALPCRASKTNRYHADEDGPRRCLELPPASNEKHQCSRARWPNVSLNPQLVANVIAGACGMQRLGACRTLLNYRQIHFMQRFAHEAFQQRGFQSPPLEC